MGGPRVSPVPKANAYSYYIEPRKWKRGFLLSSFAVALFSILVTRHACLRRVF